jgi:CelD/BcsL family acetyltransferase involved in cellulose biosynthesis
LAAGLFLHWYHTLTYKYSASDDEGQKLKPNHLLTWTAIRWGCENGFKIFDFGRTDVKDEGLRTFKNRWGAKELPLIYSTLSTVTERASSGRLMMIMQKSSGSQLICWLAGETLTGICITIRLYR